MRGALALLAVAERLDFLGQAVLFLDRDSLEHLDPLLELADLVAQPLVLCAVQDKPAAEVAAMDVGEALAPFELRKHLSANRTQGVPNMIALVKQTADRYAAAA